MLSKYYRAAGAAAVACLLLGTTAHASPTASFIMHNTASLTVSNADTSLGSVNTLNGKNTAPAGTSTGQANTGGDVHSTVVVTEPVSGASCTFQTQSVFSSLFGHYQITGSAPVLHAAGGVTPNCVQTFTFKDSTSGDYDSTMTISNF